MALIFIDSFDHYSTIPQMQLKWQNTGSSFNAVVAGAGRNGLNAIQSSFPAPQNTLPTPLSTLVIGMAYKPNSIGFNGSIMQAAGSVSNASLQNVGDGRVYVAFNGVSSSPSSLVLFANTYYYIESSFSVNADGTHITLTYIIKVNNAVILSGTLQITNSTTPAPFTVFAMSAAGGGGSALVDDFYVTDGEFLGDGIISCLFPRAAGDLAQFSPVAVMPLRTPGSTINVASALYANIVGLWVMNEGSGTTDTNLVDSTLAAFSVLAGSNYPTWFLAPASNVMEHIIFPGGGGNGFLNAGHAAALDHLPVHDMTVAIGLRWEANNESAFFTKADAAFTVAGIQAVVLPGGSIACAIVRATTQLYRQTIPGVLSTGQWNQVVITWHGTGSGVATDLHIYVNGIESAYVTSTDGTGAIQDESGHDLRIGLLSDNNTFWGSMAYFALYNGRILTTTEMGTLNTTLPITQGDATAPNWRYDNDHSPDLNDSYVQSGTAGQKDLYFFDQIGGSPGIKGVQLLSCIEKSDAGSASVENIWKSGGVEMDGAEYFPSDASYTYDREAWRKSIFTTLDWTVAEINAMQMGLKRES